MSEGPRYGRQEERTGIRGEVQREFLIGVGWDEEEYARY